MTEATTAETVTKQYIGIFSWKDFLGNGKAKHLWSAGILNTGLKPDMLTDTGFTKESENKKSNESFGIRYDADYVYESFCKMLKALGIIQDGKVDRDLLGILFNKLTEYTEGFANRVNEDSLLTKAEDLAKQFPGVGDVDHWYNVLKTEVDKTLKKPEPEASTSKSGKTKSVAA